jgi:hypothetical protein
MSFVAGHGFDFNLQFEQLFFSVVPSALFIFAAVWRTISQSRKPKIVHASMFQYTKLVCESFGPVSSHICTYSPSLQSAITAYACLAFALVALAAINHAHVSSMFIAAGVSRLIAALLMGCISAVDHGTSPRPSTLLTMYLCLSLFLDATQSRTLFLRAASYVDHVYSGVFCAAVALKVLVLVLEAQHKARWVRWGDDEKAHSPEETSGIFSLGAFFWLNKLFVAGYRTILSINTLPPLDIALDTEALHAKFSRNMDYAKLKGDKFGLFKVLAHTLFVPLLLPIIPRIFLLGFTICQPFFIETLLE